MNTSPTSRKTTYCTTCLAPHTNEPEELCCDCLRNMHQAEAWTAHFHAMQATSEQIKASSATTRTCLVIITALILLELFFQVVFLLIA